jgi:hypothetical protein
MKVTLKFWQYINGSPVRLKLRPGQTLRHFRFSRDCEGWSSESNTWTAADDGSLISTVLSDGRDCDGRLTRGGTYRSVRLYANADVESSTWNDRQIFYPEWDEVSSSQRDEYAEMANY